MSVIDRTKSIAIAKDVLERLGAGAIRVYGGIYCHINSLSILTKKMSGDDAQEIIDEIESGCHVCALGGLMLSRARLFDEVTVGDLRFGNFNNFYQKLSPFFTSRELCLIEACFEGTILGHHRKILGLEEYATLEQRRYERSIEAFIGELPYPAILRKICQNIVDNGGHFVFEMID